jgi:hypothetical protein
MNLLQLLAAHYPAWQDEHDDPLEAAYAIGLLDDDILDDLEVPALDFNED